MILIKLVQVDKEYTMKLMYAVLATMFIGSVYGAAESGEDSLLIALKQSEIVYVLRDQDIADYALVSQWWAGIQLMLEPGDAPFSLDAVLADDTDISSYFV